jgi:uncharacterized protein (DUF58 family)
MGATTRTAASKTPRATPRDAARGPLRQRVRAWWLARLPRADSTTLTQRNVYILPTPAGWSFAAMLLVCLIATINYQLNLGYLLIFLLFGVGVVSMQVTHRNLRGLTLHLRPAAPGFAQEPVPLDVVVDAPTRERHGITIEFDGDTKAGRYSGVAHTDVQAGAQKAVTLTFVPPWRGHHDVPPIRVETRFPFGLFRAWTIWVPATPVLAWPTPERPAAPWPAAAESRHGSNLRVQRDGDEWEGVRAWQRGDAMRRIVWKKVARTGELISRDTTTVIDREIWFDWQATQGMDTEARLSRLSAWVQSATQQGLAHGVRLPGTTIEPSVGSAHRVRSLNALAAFD